MKPIIHIFPVGLHGPTRWDLVAENSKGKRFFLGPCYSEFEAGFFKYLVTVDENAEHYWEIMKRTQNVFNWEG